MMNDKIRDKLRRHGKGTQVTTRTSNANINDVADFAGVSKKTVSRVINDSPLVTPATRAKVEQAIKALNYTPNTQARGLAFNKSYLLGLIYDNPNASYVCDIQQGVLDFCREHGYELVVHPCDAAADNLSSSLTQFVQRLKIDGVVVLPPLSENTELGDLLARSECRYVRILSSPLGQPEDMVGSDDRYGVEQIADHLVALGHTRIGHIRGPEHSNSARERHNGFKDALAARQLSIDDQYVASGAYTYESGVHCAQQLLSLTPRPTAIFASNDEMALGVLVAAAKLGIKVPEELSVVGYDDEPHASMLSPSLTTINQDVRTLGRLAAQKLIALCKGDRKHAAGIQTLVTPRLIERESTATAPD